MVMRLPSRKRCTSLPSLTARRPNVVSAMSAWRQNSEIWLRIWSFFIGPGFGKRGWAAADRPRVLPSSAQRGNEPVLVHAQQSRGCPFPSLRAKRSNPSRDEKKVWIASSLTLLATTTWSTTEVCLMRRPILMLTLLAAALWAAPALAQSNAQLGPLCTSEGTPADAQIAACNKIIALKVFSGEKLATIYFWRAVGWNKKGNYPQVIADATEAIRLQPNIPSYNLRGSAYYDKGEYDIAIADFNDALRMGPQGGIVYHNRGNAYRSKGDYTKAIADYDAAIKFDPKEAYSWQNRGASKQALGDLDGALADVNEAIRLNPTLPSPLINRAVIWRAKGDLGRAIADATEAIRLAK